MQTATQKKSKYTMTPHDSEDFPESINPTSEQRLVEKLTHDAEDFENLENIRRMMRAYFAQAYSPQDKTPLPVQEIEARYKQTKQQDI